MPPSQACSAALLAARQTRRLLLALRMCGPSLTRIHVAFCHHACHVSVRHVALLMQRIRLFFLFFFFALSLRVDSFLSRAPSWPQPLFLVFLAPPELSHLSTAFLALSEPSPLSLVFLASPGPLLLSLVCHAPHEPASLTCLLQKHRLSTLLLFAREKRTTPQDSSPLRRRNCGKVVQKRDALKHTMCPLSGQVLHHGTQHLPKNPNFSPPQATPRHRK